MVSDAAMTQRPCVFETDRSGAWGAIWYIEERYERNSNRNGWALRRLLTRGAFREANGHVRRVTLGSR